MAHPSRLSRRALLAAAAGTTASGLGIPVFASPARAVTSWSPVTMAMHLHGSFSERAASMHAHLDQAQQLGIDVLFWTDHDMRVSAQGYRQEVQFYGWQEWEDGVDWNWRRRVTGNLRSSNVSWEQWNRGKVGVFTATADTWTFSTMWLDGEAWNSTYSTCLADTTLELDVFPDELGGNARLVLEVDTSYHPATGGRDAGTYKLAYRIGPYSTIHRSTSGRYGVIEIPAAQWTWTLLNLRPVDDIAALWPDLVAEDNSLYRLRIGVEARRGATCTYAVARLGFVRSQRAGNAGIDLVRSVMARYDTAYPGQRQYAALEVSGARHLNWFGANLAMPDYPNAPFDDKSAAATQAMVDFIHSHGGLACYNHPLYDTKEASAQETVAHANFGAELIEVGAAVSEPVTSTLYVFDALARNTIFTTANGVSDDHDGVDWLGRNVNWITGVWAGSVELPQLTDALLAGRAWFYRPNKWSGELDLQLSGQTSMGCVLLTSASSVEVRAMATALPTGGTLEIITGEADRAAPAPATTSQAIPASSVSGGYHSFNVDTTRSRYVRTMVRDATGEIVGVSNPLWLLRSAPPGGIPPQRVISA